MFFLDDKGIILYPHYQSLGKHTFMLRIEIDNRGTEEKGKVESIHPTRLTCI